MMLSRSYNDGYNNHLLGTLPTVIFAKVRPDDSFHCG